MHDDGTRRGVLEHGRLGGNVGLGSDYMAFTAWCLTVWCMSSIEAHMAGNGSFDRETCSA